MGKMTGFSARYLGSISKMYFWTIFDAMTIVQDMFILFCKIMARSTTINFRNDRFGRKGVGYRRLGNDRTRFIINLRIK